MTAGTQILAKAPIVQYWHSEKTPDEIAELLSTFSARNSDLRHLVFNEASAEEFIEERFTPREVAAFRACAVPAMQADYLRYCAVLALGGVYADADSRCIAPLSSLLDAAEGGILFGWPELPPLFRTPLYEWRERAGPYRAIPNSIFAFKSPGHPLLELVLEIATTNVENRIAENVALTTGPGIFTSLYLLREMGSLEAYVDFVEGGVFEQSASVLCDVIRNYACIDRSFEGVRIPPMATAERWIMPPKTRPAYKDTDAYWINAKSSIFR